MFWAWDHFGQQECNIKYLRLYVVWVTRVVYWRATSNNLLVISSNIKSNINIKQELHYSSLVYFWLIFFQTYSLLWRECLQARKIQLIQLFWGSSIYIYPFFRKSSHGHRWTGSPKLFCWYRGCLVHTLPSWSVNRGPHGAGTPMTSKALIRGY